MLDMDLDLEADLGIDTVKQAELFATIRTHYNIPRREDLRLSEYNTLTKVVQFMRDALWQPVVEVSRASQNLRQNPIQRCGRNCTAGTTSSPTTRVRHAFHC